MSVTLEDLHEGMVVVIKAFDDLPEHRFRIEYVFEDCVGGYSLDGPLHGEYGEPDLDLIKSIATDPSQGS